MIIWELDTGNQIASTSIPTPIGIKFAGDSSKLLVATKNQATWLDLKAGGFVETPAIGSLKPYNYITISSDCKHIASALDEESEVHIYSVDSGSILHTLSR